MCFNWQPQRHELPLRKPLSWEQWSASVSLRPLKISHFLTRGWASSPVIISTSEVVCKKHRWKVHSFKPRQLEHHRRELYSFRGLKKKKSNK
jgi:hypothetical protein